MYLYRTSTQLLCDRGVLVPLSQLRFPMDVLPFKLLVSGLPAFKSMALQS